MGKDKTTSSAEPTPAAAAQASARPAGLATAAADAPPASPPGTKSSSGCMTIPEPRRSPGSPGHETPSNCQRPGREVQDGRKEGAATAGGHPQRPGLGAHARSSVRSAASHRSAAGPNASVKPLKPPRRKSAPGGLQLTESSPAARPAMRWREFELTIPEPGKSGKIKLLVPIVRCVSRTRPRWSRKTYEDNRRLALLGSFAAVGAGLAVCVAVGWAPQAELGWHLHVPSQVSASVAK